jgi:hypothetical protein
LECIVSILSRSWATPLTVGAFCIIALTGGLMFFHVDMGLAHLAHEWLSWLLVAAVVLHLTVNWHSFKRYFASTGARWILSVSVVALVTLLSLPTQKNESPPVLAYTAVVNAPLSSAALLAGKSPEQAQAELAEAGLQVVNTEQSIFHAAAGSRELISTAIKVLYSKSAREASKNDA